MMSIAKPLERLVSTYQRSVLIETGVAGGMGKPLLELEDDDELLDEEELLLDELEDELLELLDDELLELLDDELLELLEDELLDEVSPEPCPPHAPITATRAETQRILRNFIVNTLLIFCSAL